jgi:hypothetical protein
LLDESDDEQHLEQAARTRRLLRIILEPELASNPDEVRRILRGLDLLNEFGELDFARQAKRLGERLFTYGDMDFVLLAMWSVEFRALLGNQQEHPPTKLRKELVKLARNIRAEMFAALA